MTRTSGDLRIFRIPLSSFILHLTVTSTYIYTIDSSARKSTSELVIMVLSTSTLNLKFMQRAAARNAQAQANGGPSAPATPQAAAAAPIASSSNPTPVTRASEPTPQATPKYVSSAVEEAAGEEVWFMPNRPTRPARTDESSRKWTFEPSYVPFLAKAREGSQGGGGRMKFGFGEEEKKDTEEEAGKDTEGGSDDDGAGEGALTVSSTSLLCARRGRLRSPCRRTQADFGSPRTVQPASRVWGAA